MKIHSVQLHGPGTHAGLIQSAALHMDSATVTLARLVPRVSPFPEPDSETILRKLRLDRATDIGALCPKRCFGDLLSGPFSCGMGRDVEMNYTAPVMGHHHEHEQDPKINRLNNQKISGN